MKLKNKNVLFTGAAGDIGRATVKRFLAEGARVMMADWDEKALSEFANTLSGEVGYIQVDVSRMEDNQKMVEATVERFGGIDVFVANAGIEGKVSPIDECSLEEFNRVLSVNVSGVWAGLKAVKAVMKERGGSIVITSSGAGVMGSPNMMPYNSSKHAVIGLMRCAAKEFAPFNIRVNTVNPGPLDSRMMRSIEDGYAPGSSGEFKQALEQMTPMGRYGRADEISGMMLFLASEDASYCTGGVYMVDGGNSC
ncbi:SDR family oxidoreductase [Aestuariicella hydrocarbonica]|uniref:SDR family oxidoreductase n=1 Tax=Pseudomaricurvus hydrocarbonicus TaxID=1470433 RepID=A0A9E5JU16_9GAMM|nr:SDR family oxidoreductase [Aestuariicella hydrocarbonica]NHO66837.1 SDR family oxidoreductase [Aestuariicella hydrocarbonica]